MEENPILHYENIPGELFAESLLRYGKHEDYPDFTSPETTSENSFYTELGNSISLGRAASQRFHQDDIGFQKCSCPRGIYADMAPSQQAWCQSFAFYPYREDALQTWTNWKALETRRDRKLVSSSDPDILENNSESLPQHHQLPSAFGDDEPSQLLIQPLSSRNDKTALFPSSIKNDIGIPNEGTTDIGSQGERSSSSHDGLVLCTSLPHYGGKKQNNSNSFLLPHQIFKVASRSPFDISTEGATADLILPNDTKYPHNTAEESDDIQFFLPNSANGVESTVLRDFRSRNEWRTDGFVITATQLGTTGVHKDDCLQSGEDSSQYLHKYSQNLDQRNPLSLEDNEIMNEMSCLVRTNMVLKDAWMAVTGQNGTKTAGHSHYENVLPYASEDLMALGERGYRYAKINTANEGNYSESTGTRIFNRITNSEDTACDNSVRAASFNEILESSGGCSRLKLSAVDNSSFLSQILANDPCGLAESESRSSTSPGSLQRETIEILPYLGSKSADFDMTPLRCFKSYSEDLSKYSSLIEKELYSIHQESHTDVNYEPSENQWTATWVTASGRKAQRSYSTVAYGHKKALEMAESSRKQGMLRSYKRRKKREQITEVDSEASKVFEVSTSQNGKTLLSDDQSSIPAMLHNRGSAQLGKNPQGSNTKDLNDQSTAISGSGSTEDSSNISSKKIGNEINESSVCRDNEASRNDMHGTTSMASNISRSSQGSNAAQWSNFSRLPLGTAMAMGTGNPGLLLNETPTGQDGSILQKQSQQGHLPPESQYQHCQIRDISSLQSSEEVKLSFQNTAQESGDTESTLYHHSDYIVRDCNNNEKHGNDRGPENNDDNFPLFGKNTLGVSEVHPSAEQLGKTQGNYSFSDFSLIGANTHRAVAVSSVCLGNAACIPEFSGTTCTNTAMVSSAGETTAHDVRQDVAKRGVNPDNYFPFAYAIDGMKDDKDVTSSDVLRYIKEGDSVSKIHLLDHGAVCALDQIPKKQSTSRMSHLEGPHNINLKAENNIIEENTGLKQLTSVRKAGNEDENYTHEGSSSAVNSNNGGLHSRLQYGGTSQGGSIVSTDGSFLPEATVRAVANCTEESFKGEEHGNFISCAQDDNVPTIQNNSRALSSYFYGSGTNATVPSPTWHLSSSCCSPPPSSLHHAFPCQLLMTEAPTNGKFSIPGTPTSSSSRLDNCTYLSMLDGSPASRASCEKAPGLGETIPPQTKEKIELDSNSQAGAVVSSNQSCSDNMTRLLYSFPEQLSTWEAVPQASLLYEGQTTLLGAKEDVYNAHFLHGLNDKSSSEGLNSTSAEQGDQKEGSFHGFGDTQGLTNIQSTACSQTSNVAQSNLPYNECVITSMMGASSPSSVNPQSPGTIVAIIPPQKSQNKTAFYEKDEHIPGVTFDKKNQRWGARWSAPDGRRAGKYFPVNQYGYDTAKKLATQCRFEALSSANSKNFTADKVFNPSKKHHKLPPFSAGSCALEHPKS